MAVYNVEKYIEQAIQSVINQTEKSWQLILVNDGTPDNSGHIAKRYSEEYDNILYLEKENGGVSSARNMGMTIAEGEFWNFMDPDDIISDNTLEAVYKFFHAYKRNTDIVCIPVHFFGDRDGFHPLSTYKLKFGKGLINLLDDTLDARMIQNFCNSSYFKSEILKNRKFDVNMLIGEDFMFVNEVVKEKMTLGFVNTTEYWYRRVKGEGAINSTFKMMSHESLAYRYNLYDSFLRKLQDNLGYIPSYFQKAFLYDLSWVIKPEKLASHLYLDEYERHCITQQIFKIIFKYVDFEVIKEFPINLTYNVKEYLLDGKADYLDLPSVQKNYFEFTRSNHFVFKYSDIYSRFVVANKSSDKISLYYYICYPVTYQKYMDNFRFCLYVAGTDIYPISVEDNAENYTNNLYTKMMEAKLLRFDIDIKSDKYLNQEIRLVLVDEIDRRRLPIREISYVHSPLKPKANGDLYAISKDFAMTMVNNELRILKRESEVNQVLYSKAFSGNLGLMQDYLLYQKSKNKQIWLFEDRPNQANDNAEVLFKYVKKYHPEIEAVFLINEYSVDFERLLEIGKVVPKFSKEHALLWSIADVIISSNAEHQIINPFWHSKIKNTAMRKLNNPPFVFLQHGVMANGTSLSEWINLINKNIRLYNVSTKYEEANLIGEAYHYDKEVVKLCGLPRFDMLTQKQEKKAKFQVKEKLILFTPTWRNSLSELTFEEFKGSNYFKEIDSFLNDVTLFKQLKKSKYRIAFKLHPHLLKYQHLFTKNDYYYIAEENYQELYLKADIAITDFSSAVTDFAYMKKPIIKYLFDDKTFLESHTVEIDIDQLKEGSYGKVYENDAYDLFLEELIKKLRNPVMDKVYQEMIDRDFPYKRGGNSERVYNAIVELLKSIDG